MSGISSQGAVWGNWVVHDGRPNPLPVGAWVHGLDADGVEWEDAVEVIGPNEVSSLDWDGMNRAHMWGQRTIEYRVRRPDVLQGLVKLAANPFASPCLPVAVPVRPQRDRVPA